MGRLVVWLQRGALVALGAVLPAQSRADSLDPAVTLARLKTEAVPAWLQLDEFYREFDVRLDAREDKQPREGSASSFRSSFRVKRRGGAILVEEIRSPVGSKGSGSEEVRCFADGLGFILAREGSASPWVIGLASRDEAAQEIRRSLDSWIGYYRAGCSVYGRSLAEAINESAFELVEASREANGNLRVTFHLPASGQGPAKIPDQRGWIELDPANHWIVRASDLTVGLPSDPGGPSRLTTKFDYEVSPTGFPLLKGIDAAASAERGSSTTKSEVTQFDRQVGADEFLPSAYGFENDAGPFASAPNGLSTAWRRGAWLLGAGATLMALALTLRLYLRRACGSKSCHRCLG